MATESATFTFYAVGWLLKTLTVPFVLGPKRLNMLDGRYFMFFYL